MADKKGTKIIIKFSNDSTANKGKKGKGKGKKSGPCEGDINNGSKGAKKLRP